MPDLLPTTPLLIAFMAASLALALTPGPGVLFIVARSATQGRGPGLVSVAGVAFGNLANALLASLGLAALLSVSALAFMTLKFAGAAYLIYMGLQMLLTNRHHEGVGELPSEPLRKVARDGFIVALLNPKTTLFFAAFLPQFIAPGAVHPLQISVLGSIFVLIAAVTDSFYAVAASKLAGMLTLPRKMLSVGRKTSGLVFIGLGLFAAMSDDRTKH